MISHEVAWRGLDDDARLDVASVEFGGEGGFVATGSQTSETYRAKWDLIVDSRWRTRLLTVDVEGAPSGGSLGENGATWQRHLNLWRRDSRNESLWRCESGESGEVPRDFGEVGIARERLPLLAEAIDVDLAHCPLTNTMPIHRLHVMRPGIAEKSLTTAWVSMPDLAVRASSQFYASAADGLPEIASALDPRVASVVHYRSSVRSVDLSVDAHGFVITYPELAARIDLD